ncbi:MAG: alpha/beta fold hydrolase [Candidatus Binatia bacterium]
MTKPRAAYRAPRWLPGGQLQTLYAYCLKQTAIFTYRRERWETLDGDFIELDWLEGSHGPRLLVLFHGLEGCSRSNYAVSLMNQLRREGWQGVVPHFRGCGGEINRLSRSYHAADSAEIDWILRRLKGNHKGVRLYAVGVSLGGNMLLKWLGEQAEQALDVIDGAVAVSAPVDLQIAAGQLDYGWNKRIYTSHFLGTMKPKVLTKIATHGLKLNPRIILASSTFREIDNLYTAPVHGFRDAKDYWVRSSSRPWLEHIKVPTLLINARNDPFYPGDALPTGGEVAEAVTLEYPDSGGHVGFVSGRFPGQLQWLPRRIVNFLSGVGVAKGPHGVKTSFTAENVAPGLGPPEMT